MVFQSHPYIVFGHLVDDGGREIRVRGELQDHNGAVLTSAEAVIIRLKQEQIEMMREDAGK